MLASANGQLAAQPPATRANSTSLVQVDQADAAARTHLASIDAYLANREWDDAVEMLREVMKSFGEQVISDVDGRYISVREHCHRRIARLPQPALEHYRGLVDPLANQWLEEGITQRDRSKLQQVVHDFFCSSAGDDALLALGELALERGEHGSARRYWESLTPALRSPDGRPLWQALIGIDPARDFDQVAEIVNDADASVNRLVYPGTDTSLADVRARLALVSILEGSLDRARVELDWFRRFHPDAAGRLGGRNVQYGEQLAQLLTSAAEWPQSTAPADWPTFGGSTNRSGTAQAIGGIRSPAWEQSIGVAAPGSTDQESLPLPGTIAQQAQDIDVQPLRHYPIVVDDLLLWNDHSAIYAYHLSSGRPAWEGSGVIFRDDRSAEAQPEDRGTRLGTPRFSMTASDGRLYARVGAPVTTRPPDVNALQSNGYLVCLDLQSSGRLLWKTQPEDPQWAFEGAPVVKGNNLYVAMRRSDVRPQAHVACFDANTGRLRWRRFVCAAESPGQGQQSEITNNVLTLSEETLYVNTNLGAIAALAADIGQIRWIVTYPRTNAGGSAADVAKSGSHPRDLTPCVYYGGTIFAAPADSHDVFALDGATGTVLWRTSQAADVRHLLGVSGPHLIASGRHLWWIDARTGEIQWQWPDSPRAGEIGRGRGVIAGGEVLWPSQQHIRIFDAQSMRQTREPLDLDVLGAGAGNLLVAGGHLVIAAADRLYAFKIAPPASDTVTQRPDDASSDDASKSSSVGRPLTIATGVRRAAFADALE
ncbi:MAG: PQQ-binding-like beta-propeller repeat protein [Pirellulales bacterium]